MRIQSPPAVIAPLNQDSSSRPTQRTPAGEVFAVSPEELSPPCASGKPCPPSTKFIPYPVGWVPETGTDPSPARASAAYRQAESFKKSGLLSDLAKYKEDQLLQNPGGDAYDLQTGNVSGDLRQQRSFTHRIGKDLSDAWENCKRFVQNLAFGSETSYRDSSGQIRKTRKKGLIGTLGDFFKNTASALSFGLYTPKGEDKPSGIMERMFHFVKKTKQALFGDLILGVPCSIIRMG